MGRSALPSTDRSVVWLADLIEATEVVGASAKPCAPSSGVARRCQAAVRTGVHELASMRTVGPSGRLE